MPQLHDPITMGALNLKNRIVMSPLTRSRATDTRIPNALMMEYYTQRATAGLIISEATSISPQGIGYADTPGIWSDEKVEGWKAITKAVHDAGSKIVLQLWHVGRVSDPVFLNGDTPVAPSAIAITGPSNRVRPDQHYVTPRALSTAELPAIIADYRKGAENAKRAGFDGVELHGANGYLLDQFLHDGSNTRTDNYGGSVENRARLMIEAIDAAIDVWGADRVGLHLSPRDDAHDMHDSNPLAIYTYVVEQMQQRHIAFICARESLEGKRISPKLKKIFSHVWIANEKFDATTAQHVLDNGEADAVAFGQLFIANPDLPARIVQNGPYNTPDSSTFYGGAAKGYTDYPFLADAKQRQSA